MVLYSLLSQNIDLIGILSSFLAVIDPNLFTALPGDTISFRGHDLVISSGHFWLEGDCKNNSVDSRDYGPVPIGLLEGKVAFSLIPLKIKIR